MSILRRYPRDGFRARMHRRLRLGFGGYRALAAQMPTQGQLTDLGCGWGLLDHVLVDAAPERKVLAVDHAEHRIAALAASAKELPITALVGSLESIDLPPSDGIILLDVMHYFDADTQAQILLRVLRALRPRGVLLIRDPDPSAWFRFRLTRLHERIATGMGWTKASVAHFRSGGEWAALLEGFDLDVTLHSLSVVSPYADRLIVARRP